MKNKNLTLSQISLLLGICLGFATAGHTEVITKDKVAQRVGVFRGATAFAQAVDRPYTVAGDYVVDFTTAGGGVEITNAAFLNIAASNDVLTLAFWMKKYENNNSSAFWVVSPSASGGSRGFAANVPWDAGGGVYFDTAGCCETTQRINAGINTFAGYTDDTWWNGWHHWVFMKNGPDKQVWVDGQYFFGGYNTAPLTNDITVLWLGWDYSAAPGANLMRGLMDDFAVYTNVLSDVDIGRLYTGTAPDKLAGTNYLLAYWAFNDAAIFGNPVGNPMGFSITVNDVGANVMDTNTVELKLNNTAVMPTSITKVGTVNTIAYAAATPPSPAGATNSIYVAIKDKNGSPFSTTGTYVVPAYKTLPASLILQAGQVDKNLPGFKFLTFQVDTTTAPGNLQGTEDILAGKYGTNVAVLTDPFDPNISWVDARGYFTQSLTLNFTITPGTPAGRFTDTNGYPDLQYPGIPGTTLTISPYERFACEVYAALEFPASGLYTFVVNSDDGFRTTCGANPFDLFSAVNLGEYNAGRAASDTTYQFFVEQAGVYPFRTIHWQGNGGGSFEWFMVKPDGTRVLLNDVTNSIAAYQWLPTITASYVKSVSPADKVKTASPDLVSAVVVEGTTPIPPASVTLAIDGSPVAATPSKAGNEITVTYVPSPLFAIGSTHTAAVAFPDGANTITQTWSFTVGAYSKDVVAGYVGTMAGNAAFSSNTGGRSGQAGDYSLNLGTSGNNAAVVERAGMLLSPAVAKDEMTFAFWVKLTQKANNSAFWVYSPSATGNARGWQAHVPYGNDIYFDTAGCCAAGNQRINRTMNTANFPDFNGDPWWNNWHHWVFMKKQGYKAIWVDGKFFHSTSEAETADPLPNDFTSMTIGAANPVGASLRGFIDDFAVYSTALTTNQIQQLAAGAAPNSLDPNAGVLAHWNFNDPAATAVSPTVSVSVVNGMPVILFTGKLQSCATVNGQYAEVVGATSPYQVDTTKAQQLFYRASQ